MERDPLDSFTTNNKKVMYPLAQEGKCTKFEFNTFRILGCMSTSVYRKVITIKHKF